MSTVASILAGPRSVALSAFAGPDGISNSRSSISQERWAGSGRDSNFRATGALTYLHKLADHTLCLANIAQDAYSMAYRRRIRFVSTLAPRLNGY